MRLAQRTGTPVVVTDTDGQEPAVLLPLEAYEFMMDALAGVSEGGIDDVFDDDEGDIDEDELDFPFDIPMQEMDQDMPFAGEEVEERVVLEDVPFDPPIPETNVAPVQLADDPSEEQFT